MSGEPLLRISGAALAYGGRTVWSGLDLAVRKGEYLAVIGPNGTGKTSLLRAILGLAPLSAGTIAYAGARVGRGNRRIGYVPQREGGARWWLLRARDLVALGLDGQRPGPGLPSRARRRRVDALLAEVGASAYAGARVSELSGGERERLRIAQALAADPGLLLLDEPLASLDLAHQAQMAALIEARREQRGIAIIMVTHDVNPILQDVDRVLYLAAGGFRVGTPEQVLRASVLSDLYGSPVDVVRVGGRVVVAGVAEDPHHRESQGAPMRGER